ncbi:hypothetical protein PS2_005985 [Malus domestica]
MISEKAQQNLSKHTRGEALLACEQRNRPFLCIPSHPCKDGYGTGQGEANIQKYHVHIHKHLPVCRSPF